MANTNETIADIIAEIRALSNPISDGIIAINGRSIADRLEAAIKREKAAIEADALVVGGIVEAAHKRELSKNASNFGQLGDAAKLREALNESSRIASDLGGCRLNDYWKLNEIVRVCEAALSTPPRNCDLARDWMRDLYAHFQPPASIKREMPPEWVDAVMAFCRWLVAPATEQEGGNK